MISFKELIEAKQNLATPKQREYMDNNDILYSESTTKEEATLFIQQFIDDMNEHAGDYDAENYGDRPWRD